MKKRILDYMARIDRTLEEDQEGTDYEALMEEHLVQLDFFMHERLIHLLVTLAFGLLTFGTFFLLIVSFNPGLIALFFALLVLLVPYIMHYYLLENGVQKMYGQYDEMRKKNMAKTVILSCRDMEIPVNMIRSNRKTYGLSINDRAEVSLRIPLRGSEREALNFAKEKSAWIYEKYQKQMQKLQRQKELRSQSNLSEEQRKGLERRYRLAAKEYFPKRAAYYSGQLGVDYGKIRIGGQKTCFGSCSSSGTLSFNWRLMLAPPKVLDYVVVHELCHCRHMNHSKEFWAEVERIMPDYKEYQKWLKENGDTLQV